MLYILFYNIFNTKQHILDIVLCQNILTNFISFAWQMVLLVFDYKDTKQG